MGFRPPSGFPSPFWGERRLRLEFPKAALNRRPRDAGGPLDHCDAALPSARA